jgi:putative ABC transport system permease protein
LRTRAEAAAEATLYLPWHNAGLRPQAMLVRTTGGTATLESISLRIREIDPQATIAEAGLLSDRIGKTLAPQRFRANLLAGLSVLAAVLAVLGAYSVTAFAVASGRREQAIRLALGERVGEAQRRVIFGVVRPAALGVAAGLAVAWYARQFVDAFLFETSATQLGLLAIPAAVLVLVALAALIPASRLSNLDPASVFRQDR